MKSPDHDHAWASDSYVHAFHLVRLLAPVVALSLLVCGCGKEDSTADPATLHSGEAVKAPRSEFTVFDAAGNAVDPFDTAKTRAVVFIFVSTDCPISNRYAPEIRRIEAKFGQSGIGFWLVYPDADTSAEAIQKHLKEYQLPLRALRDPQHGLVRLSQVRVTPEAAVYFPDRRLAYHGRIDNRYVDLGRDRREATEHDLQVVLEAVLEGKPVPYATARAVGCYIPDPK